MTTSPKLFPIRELVHLTGVNASTLRAWEYRHALLRPVRTPSGHRLYSMQDVQRVQRLQELLGQGLGLTEIGAMLEDDDSRTVATPPQGTTAWQDYLYATLRALEDFSVERLEALYNEACAIYPIDLVTENLLLPVMTSLGESWEQRPAGIAEEHFFSAWLRNKLGARIHHSTGAQRGRLLIVACLPGERHDIGLLLFSLAAMQENHGIVYLGADMPIRQIQPIALRTHPEGIVLSGRAVKNPNAVIEDIAWLVGSSKVPVFVGSHFSVQAQDELRRVGAIPLGTHLALALRGIEKRALASSRKVAGVAA